MSVFHVLTLGQLWTCSDENEFNFLVRKGFSLTNIRKGLPFCGRHFSEIDIRSLTKCWLPLPIDLLGFQLFNFHLISNDQIPVSEIRMTKMVGQKNRLGVHNVHNPVCRWQRRCGCKVLNKSRLQSHKQLSYNTQTHTDIHTHTHTKIRAHIYVQLIARYQCGEEVRCGQFAQKNISFRV